ncbi:MarR family transcriptional regulator [Aestuariivita sp.]|jgi:DNA-binding MarR family transcriptional regulator|uniref:MarR family winged helix-turn-helix transcriptional regulator n=1 Tax=Aestuariivita sp. TaxID=1872407 RepID=UPI002173C36C|nr:MarR family transcriptional regulator [Aestuariivita sp.]MCE8005624.1 MarR family transcriptional regulator [Aestuariivita sp.]
MTDQPNEQTATQGDATAPRRLSDDAIHLGVLDRFVGLHLRAAYEASYADFEGLLGPDAIRPGYFTMLTLIANNPGISQTQIGRSARRDKSAVTKALRHMEDEGLITRTRLPDDRRTYVSELTAKGVELQLRMQNRAMQHVARIIAVIGPERHAALVDTLHDIIEQMPDLGG